MSNIGIYRIPTIGSDKHLMVADPMKSDYIKPLKIVGSEGIRQYSIVGICRICRNPTARYTQIPVAAKRQPNFHLDKDLLFLYFR